jgi:hypothetical protein
MTAQSRKTEDVAGIRYFFMAILHRCRDSSPGKPNKKRPDLALAEDKIGYGLEPPLGNDLIERLRQRDHAFGAL